MQGYRSHRPVRRDDPVTQSGATLETQGTAMALNHPVESRPEGGPHPAVSLIVGFGVIIAVAIVVHVVFNQLV